MAAKSTRAHILVYTLLLVPVALAPALHLDRRAGLSGGGGGAERCGSCVGAWRIWRRDEAVAEADKYAVEKAFFRFSLLYLFLHFGAFLVEAALHAYWLWGLVRWLSAPNMKSTSAASAAILALGWLLAAFVALVFALTVVKVTQGDPMQGL